MRILFVFLLLVHGLIHLLGFAKGFGLAEVRQLTLPISRIAGIFWFAAFALSLVTALLLLFRNPNWWCLGIMASLLSEVLVIYYWRDARFGTIANVIVLLICILGYGKAHFYAGYLNDERPLLRSTSNNLATILTEADILSLPLSVQKYIRNSGAVGRPRVKDFRISFEGKLRKDDAADWMLFKSEQHNFIEIPTRLFFMNATMKHLPVAGVSLL